MSKLDLSVAGPRGRLPDSRARWVMISLVFLATVVNYLDRQTLSVVAPVLIDQFHMSNEAYSHVIFAFMLAYTIMNGVSGPIIDRLGTRIGYALTMAWWSAAAMLHALTRGVLSLGIYRFLLGMGEAGNWPAAVKVVAEWFPVEERALASGIFNSGSSVGAIMAPPIVVWILLRLGWRDAFVWVGMMGFLWLALWMLLYHPPKAVEKKEDKGNEPPRPSLLQLLRTRFVWSFTVAKVFLDPVWYFYIFWFPEYLKRARHFDMASIGKYAWIPFLVAGFGNILGGWLSAVMLRHRVPLTIARKGTVTLFALLMACAIPAVLVHSAFLSFVLVSSAMLGYTGVTANMLAFPADVFPGNVVASIWGLAGLGSGFGGMVFALVTGWLVDHFSYLPVFILAGLMPFIAVAIIWFIIGPLQPASEPACSA